MRKDIALGVAAVMLGSALTGCTMNRNQATSPDASPNTVQTNQYYQNRDGMMPRDGMVPGEAGMFRANQVNNWHRNSKMEASDQIAEAITNLEMVKSSYVMLTDHNAYVGVVLDENHTGKYAASHNKYHEVSKRSGMNANAIDEGTELSDVVKNQIANVVKQHRGQVKNVYVSTNPDFVGRMNGYWRDARDGKPLTGIMDEFNEMVNRVFPEEAGTVR